MRLLLLLAICLPHCAFLAKAFQAKAFQATDPSALILDAFQTHRVIALGNVEFRGNEQSHAFQLSLLRHRRFPETVTDILVEFGSRRYQPVMDRYIAGEDVTIEMLRPAWRDTTQFEFEWDLPIYEDFFRAVRTLNQSLPAARRIRVLLGDPAIDWDKIKTLADLKPWVEARDASAVEVLQKEVLDKANRRALVVYGGYHLRRKGGDNLVTLVEKAGTPVFSVLPETRRDLSDQYRDIAQWPIPSAVLVTNEAFDARLYLGPPSTMTMAKPGPQLCGDPAYLAMRMQRLGLVPPPPKEGGKGPGNGPDPAGMLLRLCAEKQ